MLGHHLLIGGYGQSLKKVAVFPLAVKEVAQGGEIEGFAEAPRAAVQLYACPIYYVAYQSGLIHVVGVSFDNLLKIR